MCRTVFENYLFSLLFSLQVYIETFYSLINFDMNRDMYINICMYRIVRGREEKERFEQTETVILIDR